MKKSLFFSLILCMIYLIPANAQVGKFLKNVKNSVKQELLGTPDNKNTRPEPPCACDPAELVMAIGKYQIDYSELNISVLDDGRILVRDNVMDNYYIAKSGVTEGPYKAGDPKITQLQVKEQSENEGENKDHLLELYKGFISKSGDKYLITFNGQSYGPYALISRFVVSKSKDKFAAIVTENVGATEDQGKKMDEAIKNAKSDQERMQLAMQFSQQMQQSLMNSRPESIIPKFITNVPGAKVEAMTALGAQFYNNLKYDDILMVSMDKVMDLQGKTIMTYSSSNCDPASMYISSDNSRYACYNYGTLTFSDKKILTELFNLRLINIDGKIYLAYMYYSPKKNAIMQCKIPF